MDDVRFAIVDGAQVAYDVTGAGPPLVLLHEGLGDRRLFDEQLDAFAERYRVIRYDLPGFGRSEVPKGPWSHHGVLAALLDQLDIGRAALLGMSLGGGVALDFARAAPARVGALVLAAAGVPGFAPSASSDQLFGPVGAAFEAGDFARAIDLSVHLWVDGPTRRPEEVPLLVRERLRALFTEMLARSREGGRPPDPLLPPTVDHLGAIRAPTLVVVGSADVPDILAQADLLARTIPGARQHIEPDVAHVLNLERPEAFNRVVLEFLAEVWPAS